MNREKADQIVRAVLYEGYNLYPYRPSVKNRHRWTFGGLYPASYSGVQEGSDASGLHMQCLVRGGDSARIGTRVLFLHLRWRRIGKLPRAIDASAAPDERDCEFVESLEAGSDLHQTWQEAAEREVLLEDLTLGDFSAGPREKKFSFSGERRVEPIRDPAGAIVGLTVYEQQSVEGRVELQAERVEDGLFRLTLRVCNVSPLDEVVRGDRDAALLRTLVSTNAVLRIEDGKFISASDPPESCRAAAASCRNQGVWPVLLGEPGDQDTLLASPIILYDYVEVAPESPGDLFDGAEIDEILTLRIMTMTDEEKRAARSIDDRTRRLMQRTESLAREQLASLHGAVRSIGGVNCGAGVSPAHESSAGVPSDDCAAETAAPQIGLSAPLRSLRISGAEVRPGDRVRLCPNPGGDIFDLALADRIATVESIEQDFEDRVYLAVTIDDDPGQDLGRARQPGHRFFFQPGEVEVLEAVGRRP